MVIPDNLDLQEVKKIAKIGFAKTRALVIVSTLFNEQKKLLTYRQCTHTTDFIFFQHSISKGEYRIPYFVRMAGIRRIQNITLKCSVSGPDRQCGSGTKFRSQKTDQCKTFCQTFLRILFVIFLPVNPINLLNSLDWFTWPYWKAPRRRPHDSPNWRRPPDTARSNPRRPTVADPRPSPRTPPPGPRPCGPPSADRNGQSVRRREGGVRPGQWWVRRRRGRSGRRQACDPRRGSRGGRCRSAVSGSAYIANTGRVEQIKARGHVVF